MVSSQTLPRGYRLGSVEIEGAVELGTASMRYDATDEGRPVRVDEYYPVRIASRADGVGVAPDASAAGQFQSGLAAFEAAGRALARIRHDGIVRVRNCVVANGTCYVVTDTVDGQTLADLLAEGRRLPVADLLRILEPVIDGLSRAHRGGLLHRQINPAAITIRTDGAALLTDFSLDAKVTGGARQTFGGNLRQITDVKPGYAALEQYSANGREGPWTDVYGLASVSYHCLTGRAPIDAPQRVIGEDHAPVSRLLRDLGAARQLAAIDAGLQVAIASRPQSVEHWRAMLLGDARTSPAENRAGRTSARGFGQAVPSRATARGAAAGAVSTAGDPGSAGADEDRRPTGLRWMVPAVTAAGITAAITWVDTDVLRGDGLGSASSGQAFADVHEPNAASLADPLASGGTGPSMVVVAAGARRVACTGRAGQECAHPGADWREVTLAEPVAVARFEVTVVDYALFLAATGRSGEAADAGRVGPGRSARGTGGRDRLPVVNVSWEDAAAYAAWLASETSAEYRLPTDAEWDYVALVDAGATPLRGAGTRGPVPVGSSRPNDLGLHDLHHNVSEWVMDCADDDDGEACQYRVRRGSSWIQPWPNPGAAARTSSRADYRAADTGFRVVRRLDAGDPDAG